MFVPDDEIVYRGQAGAELTSNAHRFVSRLAANRFLASLPAQKTVMTRGTGAHTNRPELVAVAYDPNTDARPAARRAGRRTADHRAGHPAGARTAPRMLARDPPRPDPAARGSSTRSRLLMSEPTSLRDTGSVPAEPDRRWVDRWLHRSHSNTGPTRRPELTERAVGEPARCSRAARLLRVLPIR
jgi:uncharacterized protein